MTQTRRRGAALEAAIFEATRAILAEDGLANLTFPRVAERAETSKPVIYRRWSSPADLAIAAIQDKVKRDNNGRTDEIELTGQSLSADLQQVLNRFVISMRAFGDYYAGLFGNINNEESATVDHLLADGYKIDIHAIDRVLTRAQQRGEIKSVDLPEQIKLLPFDLLRYNMLVNHKFADKQLAVLVDMVLLPTYIQALN